MKVFCCQHDIVWEDKTATQARVKALVDATHIPPGSLLVLPEMFATGFSQDVPAITETPARASEKFLATLAAERGIAVQGGVVNSQTNGRGLNESVTFAPDGAELARYAKLQPFRKGGEGAVCDAGDRLVTFHWNGWGCAPFVCYDLRFPEIFRPAARAGAQLITVIANWPEARIAHWVKLLQARAIENQCYVAGVNRVGTDPRFRYSGRSVIVDFRGEIVADAGVEEGVASAELDHAALADYRRDLPFLEDMREDFVPARAISAGTGNFPRE